MTDWITIVTAGQQALAKAQQARQEIDQILGEVSEAIAQFTKKPIRVSIEDAYRAKREQADFERLQGIPAPQEKIRILALIDSSTRRVEQLSDIEFGDQGYPVTLFWQRNSAICYTATEFENALRALLQSTYAAGKIAQMLAQASS